MRFSFRLCDRGKSVEVAINDTNFSDSIFGRYVKDEFDKYKNGGLSDEKINNVANINVIGKKSAA